MQFETYLILRREQIDATDDTFLISTEHQLPLLSESVAAVGILQPLWVQETATQQYRIVNGFKRMRAAQTVGMERLPVLLIAKTARPFDLFDLCLREKCHTRHLNPLEISNVIFKLSYFFRLRPREIIARYFPLMGLAQNDKIYHHYYPLRRLEGDIQDAIVREEISVEMAAILHHCSKEERETYFYFMQSLRLSKSNQRELWLLLQDLMRRRKQSLKDLLSDIYVRQIMDDEKLSPSQKTERVKKLFFAWRYPQYSYTLARFEKLVREVKLPGQMDLRPTPFFADSEYQVNFSFRSIEEYQKIIGVLQTILNKGTIEQIVNLVK